MRRKKKKNCAFFLTFFMRARVFAVTLMHVRFDASITIASGHQSEIDVPLFLLLLGAGQSIGVRFLVVFDGIDRFRW